jgi:hypothetical protein
VCCVDDPDAPNKLYANAGDVMHLHRLRAKPQHEQLLGELPGHSPGSDKPWRC